MKEITLYCGKHSEIECVEQEGVLYLTLKTDRITAFWRALTYLMIVGLGLNLFGLYGYYTLGEEYLPIGADEMLVFNYLAIAVNTAIVWLLIRLWRTTKSCHWETKVSIESGRLETVSALEWVGLDHNEWAVRKLVVPGNPLGGVIKETQILLVESVDGKTVVPIYASVSSNFDRVVEQVEDISGQPQLVGLKLRSKVSATGIVKFEVGPKGIEKTDMIG